MTNPYTANGPPTGNPITPYLFLIGFTIAGFFFSPSVISFLLLVMILFVGKELVFVAFAILALATWESPYTTVAGVGFLLMIIFQSRAPVPVIIVNREDDRY